VVEEDKSVWITNHWRYAIVDGQHRLAALNRLKTLQNLIAKKLAGEELIADEVTLLEKNAEVVP